MWCLEVNRIMKEESIPLYRCEAPMANFAGAIQAAKSKFIFPNYKIFNIRYQGAKIWNGFSDNIKLLSLKQFKKKLKSNIIANYKLNYLYNTISFFR